MATVSEYVERGAVRLFEGPHANRALRDAELLLLHVLRKDRAWLLAYGQNEIGYGCKTEYAELIERRYRGEPIQYIMGECEFYGLPFKVTRDVLIPRPETEHLVEKAIELAGGFRPARVVDAGAGSGAIAIALAHQLAGAAITATDLSEAALAAARENAQRNSVAGRIRFLQGDLLEPVAGESFDVVVSNPPYVRSGDRESLPVEVRDYEPGLALFAGEDGLDIYRRLIPAAWTALVPGGFIAMEIGFDQAAEVEALLQGAGFASIEFTPDLQGIPRVASGQRG